MLGIIILDHVIVASLMCLGVYVSMSPGMILGFLGNLIELLGPIGKPLGGCLTCMSSVYGAAYWLFIFGIPQTPVVYVAAIVFIVAVAGMNFTLNTLVVKRA